MTSSRDLDRISGGHLSEPTDPRRPDPEWQIGDLLPMQGGYTYPWALSLDASGQLWVRGDYSIYPTSGGTVSCPIARGPDGRLYTLAVPPDTSVHDQTHSIRWWRAERVYLAVSGSAMGHLSGGALELPPVEILP